MKKLLPISLLLLTLASCGMLWEFRELHEIEGMRWDQSSVQVFEVEIENQKPLDAFVLIRHVYGFSGDAISCSIEMEKDGERLGTEHLIVQIKDEQGEYVGEGSVDLWDVKQRFLTDFLFEPGAYSFKVKHTMPQEQVPLIMEVGLQLEKPSS